MAGLQKLHKKITKKISGFKILSKMSKILDGETNNLYGLPTKNIQINVFFFDL